MVDLDLRPTTREDRAGIVASSEVEATLQKLHGVPFQVIDLEGAHDFDLTHGLLRAPGKPLEEIPL